MGGKRNGRKIAIICRPPFVCLFFIPSALRRNLSGFPRRGATQWERITKMRFSFHAAVFFSSKPPLTPPPPGPSHRRHQDAAALRRRLLISSGGEAL